MSSLPWLPSAELGFCCGSVLLSTGFFPDFFFFFLDFDCVDGSGVELTSCNDDGFSSWMHCWLPGEEVSGVSVVSIFSTGDTEGIWKLKAKAELCPVKDIRLAAGSALSDDDEDVSFWSAAELSGRKLNLKVLSVRVQRGFSAVPSTGVELFDSGSISDKWTYTKTWRYFLSMTIIKTF